MKISYIIKILIIVGWVVVIAWGTYITFNDKKLHVPPSNALDAKTTPVNNSSLPLKDNGMSPPSEQFGSSVMLKRLIAIDEAKAKGCSTYSFSIVTPPPPIMGGSQ